MLPVSFPVEVLLHNSEQMSTDFKNQIFCKIKTHLGYLEGGFLAGLGLYFFVFFVVQ